MTGLLERVLTVRPVTPADRAAVHGFLAGLTLDSAYRRFFTGLGAPSSTLVRHLVEVDHDRREAVLAGWGEQVVGLADCTRLDDGVTVELGVVVADRWQRRGLGPRLARTVLELAIARGARMVRMHALAQNDRVARLIRRSWPGAVPARDGPVLAWDLALPVGPGHLTGAAARGR